LLSTASPEIAKSQKTQKPKTLLEILFFVSPAVEDPGEFVTPAVLFTQQKNELFVSLSLTVCETDPHSAL